MFSKNLVAASLQPVVLTILSRKEAYGYEIMQRALDLSDGKLKWTAGTLYPLMHRLEGCGLIASVWRPSHSFSCRIQYGRNAREPFMTNSSCDSSFGMTQTTGWRRSGTQSELENKSR